MAVHASGSENTASQTCPRSNSLRHSSTHNAKATDGNITTVRRTESGSPIDALKKSHSFSAPKARASPDVKNASHQFARPANSNTGSGAVHVSHHNGCSPVPK